MMKTNLWPLPFRPIRLLIATFLLIISINTLAAEPLIVKIGSAAPKTGAIAHLGQDNEMGALLAIQQINAKGNLTIAGRKVVLQLVGEDDEGEPRNGFLVAQKLVDAGVVAVVGHLNSGVSIPANLLYAKAGMVQVSPSSTNPDYTFKSERTSQGHISAYRVVAHDRLQAPALARYVLQKFPRIKRVAVLDDSTQYGKTMADDFEYVLKSQGVKIVVRDAATDKTADFLSLLTYIKQYKPQLIFWGGFYDTAAALVKQMHQLGLNVPLVVGDAACYERFLELAGHDANNTICSISGFDSAELLKIKALDSLIGQTTPGKSVQIYAPFDYNAAYGIVQAMKTVDSTEAEFNYLNMLKFVILFERAFPGKRVQIYSPFAFDAVYAIVQAMKIADSAKREAIVAAMPKVDFEGVTGRIHFDNRGDIINGPISIHQIIEGNLNLMQVVR